MRVSSSFVVALAVCALLLHGSRAGEFVSFVPGDFTHARGDRPLDNYVRHVDKEFGYELLEKIDGVGYTTYFLNMTSVAWLAANETTQPIWWHYVEVTVPHNESIESAFLYIDGGKNTDKPPKHSYPMMPPVTLSTGAVSVRLQQIPNEPIAFANENYIKHRSEDSLIAHTWRTFMDANGADPEWLLRFPMVKASVRCMDAVQHFVATLKNKGKHTSVGVENFVVAGASKRGWTTWLTGAVDTRVIGIVPIVMDVLNMRKNLNHHWEAYGNWSFALDDYVREGVTAYLNKPQFELMAKQVDPFEYRDRLTMPKYIVCSCGDEFFLPDDPQYFLADLPGETHLRMVENAEHSLALHWVDALETIEAFFHAVALKAERPQVTWKITNNGTRIEAKASRVPSKVLMWQAHDKKARDFRLLTAFDVKDIQFSRLWAGYELEPDVYGNYVAELDVPKEGWAGFFIEFEFDCCSKETPQLCSKIPIFRDHKFKHSTEVC